MDITYEACQRYVRGEATLAEARAVRAWLADPANELLAQRWMSQQAAQPLARAQSTAADPFNYAAMRDNLHARLGLPVPTPASVAVPAPVWRRWAAAAAIGGVVAGGGWALYQQHLATPTEFAASTPYGHTRTVQLPDGSQVTLNAHSSLRYAATAAAGTPREVWLDGEGFFSVKHTADNKRFVVHTTGGFNVEVLGTRFTVYRRHAQARVVLLSGKVRVAFKDHALADVILKPGELLQTTDQQPKLVVHKPVQAQAYAAFTTNELHFDATSLAELALRLQDTYGVEVVVASPTLRARKFSGTFPVGDLPVLCENLREAFHLKIERRGNQLILSE